MSYIDWIRSRVGSRKIFLVFATVIVWDDDGRVLLQRRTDFDWWGLPGGVLELDEDIQTCARRELKEETGYEAGALQLVGVYTHPKFDVTYPNGDEVQQFTCCFSAQVRGGEAQPDGVETTAQQFFSPEEAAELALSPWYRTMLTDALRGGPVAFSRPYVGTQVVDQIKDIRPFVGRDWLIAPGASVAVMRDDGRLLMVQRADNGQWALPAGYCDLGENVAHTAVRETFEETGYDVAIERVIGIYSDNRFRHVFPNGDKVKNVGVTFLARLLGGTPKLDATEVLNVAWMSIEEGLARVNDRYKVYFETSVRHLYEGTIIF